MVILKFVLCGWMLLGLCWSAQADWVTKSGFTDYACHNVNGVEDRTDGMPDFNQRQDGWQNQGGQWNWCGPVAAANCLWWFDSKFERIWMYGHGQQLPVRPLAVSDHYALVYDVLGANIDDHHPGNVVPFITTLGNSLPGGVPPGGVTANQLQVMITNYMNSAAVNLFGHYTVNVVARPTFMYIYHQVEISQDVILLLGFWQQNQQGQWWRFGGHYLTVAGVDTQNNNPRISLSDPCLDAAEGGGAGAVWNGWLVQHAPIPGHAAPVHNDAGNVSHDWYPVQVSNSPGGVISAAGYSMDDWGDFDGLNQDTGDPYNHPYDPTLPVHTEVEDVVVICPNFDYGDLNADYPTIDIESCGPAHPLSDKAWLGDQVDAEIQPEILDLDANDDGVVFFGLPWTPGTNVQVQVTVSTGAHWGYEPLYLSAWVDGNADGDFDDGPNQPAFNPAEDDSLGCTEWVIQDVAIPGPGVYNFQFCDPGDLAIGIVDLLSRFRLCSQQVGRYGYGGLWYGGVSNGRGTYDLDWVLGEVEDYTLVDQQLAVELRAFYAEAGDGAAHLYWTTASEQDNSHFRLSRRESGDWTEIAQVPSRGNSASDQSYRYTDRGLVNGCRYEYRLVAVDVNGLAEELATTAVVPTAAPLITNYALAQNYPNPFNAQTEISFALPEAGHVTMRVFDTQGRLVSTLLSESREPGWHRVTLSGSALASGVYFYSLDVNNFRAARKMILLK